MTKFFATLDGIKNAARKLKREASVTHTEALERIAVEAGYPHYKAATEALANGFPAMPEPAFNVTVQQFWSDRQLGQRGIEKVTITLPVALTDLIKRHHLVGYLSGSEVRDDDTLIGHGRADDRDHASLEACRLARAVQFMAATGLKPSRSRRGYPRGRWDYRHPGADHDKCWFHPETRTHLLTDEPYPGRATSYAAERSAWCEKHGWDFVQAAWGSIYGYGTELYLLAPRGGPLDIQGLVRNLDRSPAAVEPTQ